MFHTNQEEIFQSIHNLYAQYFIAFKHGSGGLPDTKGPGSSDVDICAKHERHNTLSDIFPDDTHVDTNTERTIYTLYGYDRLVNIYVSEKSNWDNGYKHRRTELALNKEFPKLSLLAWNIKKNAHVSTEKAWSLVLKLDGDYSLQLFDTDSILHKASKLVK